VLIDQDHGIFPVIDGGIDVRFKQDLFSGADWQLQTASPNRPCLRCLGVYEPGDVSTEIEGMLDDPTYLNGLPADHRYKRNENIFPFSANLATLEVLQMIALTTGIGGIQNFGVQRFRYNPGILSLDVEKHCHKNCTSITIIGQGDKHFTLYGEDLGAQAARNRQKLNAN
jgi:molybdopterin-synthase adenylyltransferase